jgi:hypothetical protein
VEWVQAISKAIVQVRSCAFSIQYFASIVFCRFTLCIRVTAPGCKSTTDIERVNVDLFFEVLGHVYSARQAKQVALNWTRNTD